MMSSIAKRQLLKKLGVETTSRSTVAAKGAALALILVGIAWIGFITPAQSPHTLLASGQQRADDARADARIDARVEARVDAQGTTLLHCRTPADANKAGMNDKPPCSIAGGGHGSIDPSAASSEPARSAAADKSDRYAGYPHFFRPKK